MQKKRGLNSEILIGTGIVGAAVIDGPARRNLRASVRDGADRDFWTSSANFGMVGLHGKDMDISSHRQLSRNAVDMWRNFVKLTDTAAVNLQHEHNGELTICQLATAWHYPHRSP